MKIKDNKKRLICEVTREIETGKMKFKCTRKNVKTTLQLLKLLDVSIAETGIVAKLGKQNAEIIVGFLNDTDYIEFIDRAKKLCIIEE